MPIQTQRIQYPVPFGNILDESSSPRRVGDNGGLTASSNAIYRRGGAYGSRPGRTAAYVSASTTTAPVVPVTGVRWYRANPTALTQLVVAANGAASSRLSYGGNPNLGSPTSLTSIATGSSTPTFPASFASAFDPVTNKDILIIAGGGGFALTCPGFILLIVSAVSSGTVLSCTVTSAASVATNISYTCTAADNIYTAASQYATQFNQSQAAYGGTNPCIGLAVAYSTVGLGGVPISVIEIPALTVGQATATITAAGGALVSLAGGGGGGASGTFGTVTSTLGPKAWDGSTLNCISLTVSAFASGNLASITFNTPATAAPQACVYWHQHVWYYGATGALNYVYASDINQPQNCSFMIQNGGYNIGAGDGDPGVWQCVPLGNSFYIFKRRNIYVMTGYDFQSGEYSFNVQPAIQGDGIPGPGCVARLRTSLVFWNGSSFRRLAPGAQESEDIGLPIALTQGSLTMAGGSIWVQAIGGNFGVSTLLSLGYAAPATMTLNNCAFFIVSTNGTGPTNIVMYDDDASQYLGAYAWSEWTIPQGTNPVPQSFVAFGGGLDSTLSHIEPSQLYEICYSTADSNVHVNQFGASATLDNGAAITTSITTGWITCGTPALSKELHQIYLEVTATAGVEINVTVYPSIYQVASGIEHTYPSQTIAVAATANSIGTEEQYQVLLGTLKPWLTANAFQFVISWTGSSTTQCEIVGLTLDFIEQTFTP